MAATKPIRIGCSNLTGTPEFYALRSYKLLDNGGMMATGKKDNVTADIMPHLVVAGNDARRDLIEEMIAAAREQQLMAVQIGATPYNAAYTDALPDWLITYLPTEHQEKT